MKKKLFARLLKKKKISFDEKGIDVTLSDDKNLRVKWSSVEKVILLDVFEEYSGYFLTDDYKSKVLYNDISIACNQNVVRIRTGGTPKVIKNTSIPFSRKYGTTSIHFPIFVEYKDASGNKDLYAHHYEEHAKLETVRKLEEFLPKDKIHQLKKIEGFTPLSQL